jgi:FAD/FMN-containing dehydrogenase
LYLVAQFAAAADMTASLGEAVEGLADSPEVVVATDTRGREELWQYRDLLNEAVRAQGVPHKLDVALPLAELPRFEREVRARCARDHPQARLFLYGHLGDGNVHANVLGVAPEDEEIDELILRVAAAMGGTISAEHGIGVAKRGLLRLCRSEQDIAAMRAIKRALDAHAILGRDRVLP